MFFNEALYTPLMLHIVHAFSWYMTSLSMGDVRFRKMKLICPAIVGVLIME